MALALNTAEMGIRYAVETTAGTKPSSGFVEIPGVKSIPEVGGEPNMLDSSTLANQKYKTYIMGLQDPGGSLGLTVNDYPAFRTAWDACITAHAALTGGKAMWFELFYNDSTMKSFYFTGRPVDLSYGGADVDEVLENTAYVIIEGEPEWGTAST